MVFYMNPDFGDLFSDPNTNPRGHANLMRTYRANELFNLVIKRGFILLNRKVSQSQSPQEKLRAVMEYLTGSRSIEKSLTIYKKKPITDSLRKFLETFLILIIEKFNKTSTNVLSISKANFSLDSIKVFLI